MMGIVNLLLTLPAGRQMLALPSEQNAPLEALMRQLRDQASKKATAAQVKGEESIAEYWRLVAGYSKYVARAFKRQNLKREKSASSGELMAVVGVAPRPAIVELERYAGAQQAFRAPPADERQCMLEVVNATFAPWVNAGDFIKVDLTASRLTVDSLYLVSVRGSYLAIRGFHRSPAGWYVHEGADSAPRLVRTPEDRLPEGFEIIGCITEVCKKQALIGGAQ
jgi:hypothetical protein